LGGNTSRSRNKNTVTADNFEKGSTKAFFANKALGTVPWSRGSIFKPAGILDMDIICVSYAAKTLDARAFRV
jgi:hypothetical protein